MAEGAGVHGIQVNLVGSEAGGELSGDGEQPYKPEVGEQVAVTVGTSTEDTRFLTTAVRHYQVWAHVGADEVQARASQPVKWAVGEEISPVEDMRLTEDEGRVVGEWSVFSGTRAVRVFRIPLDEGGPITTDPRYQISITDHNLTGFVDADAHAAPSPVLEDDGLDARRGSLAAHVGEQLAAGRRR